MSTSEALRTPAWLLEGITVSVPGVLEHADGRLAFTTDRGRVFDLPVSEVGDVHFPWWYFGGGVKLTAHGKRHRISFVRPNDADDIPGRLMARDGNPAGLLTAGQKLLDIGEGRRAGRAWRDVLLGE